MPQKNITLVNQLDQLGVLSAAMEQIAQEWAVPVKDALNLNLVLEEIVTNIIFYAFEDTLTHEINILLSLNDGIMIIQVEDDGKEFNPLLVEEPDVNITIENRRIGGLGIHLVRTLADSIEYQRMHSLNRIRVTKRIQ